MSTINADIENINVDGDEMTFEFNGRLYRIENLNTSGSGKLTDIITGRELECMWNHRVAGIGSGFSDFEVWACGGHGYGNRVVGWWKRILRNLVAELEAKA